MDGNRLEALLTVAQMLPWISSQPWQPLTVAVTEYEAREQQGMMEET